MKKKKLKKKKKILGILEGARERLAEGWCKGPYAIDEHGNAVRCRSPEASSWCAAGAIIAASPDGYYYPEDTMEYIDKVVKDMYTVEGVGPVYDCIVQLNQSPIATKTTMLEVFNKAISKLKGKIDETLEKEKNATCS